MSPKQKVQMRIAIPRLGLQQQSDEPSTPMPYEAPFDAESSASGSKRIRDEEEEIEWSEEEMDTLSTVLLHPFRPTSSPYPPGELPAPDIIDELTNQVLAYAFRGSPKRTDAFWPHGWAVTRQKLFDIALAESKLAHGLLDEEDRKLSRQDRSHRPGLRRHDSMDFLDQPETDNVAICLSTTLQNSAKSVTVTPPSPRRGPSRPVRASRPSLLQRGRSFTASDLEAEAAASPRPVRSFSFQPLCQIRTEPELAVPFAASPSGSRSNSDWESDDESGTIRVVKKIRSVLDLHRPFEEKKL